MAHVDLLIHNGYHASTEGFEFGKSVGNVLRILRRDLLRLLKAPAALIVAGALLVLPSLYTWYNVKAFWNPYEATGGLTVCVVNQDSGTENELVGAMNVGDLLEEELLGMDRLHFVSQDLAEAMSQLEAGKVYAVFVVPKDFTECLISPVTGNLKSPQIQYYVNEKLGPVSPKITDTAASTLSQTVNSVFVSKVSEVAAEAVDKAVANAESDVSEARATTLTRMDEASATLSGVRKDLADIQGKIGDAKDKVVSAGTAMGDTLVLTEDARAVLEDISCHFLNCKSCKVRSFLIYTSVTAELYNCI